MKHTLSVLVRNHPGVLARVASLFARREFNIDSLAVGETEDPAVSRMTIVVRVDERPLEQVGKQLHKLIDVLKIAELPPDSSVERELALIKVGLGGGGKSEVLEIVDIFKARVVDVTPSSITVEAAGSPDKIAALEELLKPHGILEMARTGLIALSRGPSGLKAPSPYPVPIHRAS